MTRTGCPRRVRLLVRIAEESWPSAGEEMNELRVQKLPPEIEESLLRMGILDRTQGWQAEPLGGGVASEIWKVDTGSQIFCAKQALPRLRVTQVWEVPVRRNSFEVDYFRTVSAIAPGVVPEIVGHDPGAGLFVMTYYPPHQHAVWKFELRDGRVDQVVAERLADALARIHNATAGDPSLALRFATDDLFFALRPEPYLIATGRKHPDLAGRLFDLVEVTMGNKKVLVHGDVSPKNILTARSGLILLDAECAWFGDPAFDIAFCLNHLLLKCLWNPRASSGFLNCFRIIVQRYLDQVGWEDRGLLERRMARLLPGLMLGRVDGKSPVEYLAGETQQEMVRGFARRFLISPQLTLSGIADAWFQEVSELMRL